MNAIRFSSVLVCCFAFTLVACTNHAPGPGGPGSVAQGSSHPGVIPTRDDRNSREVAGNPTGGANGEEYRVPTGSQIPRKYDRRGYTTDDQNPSFDYDQNDIRLQSTNNVGDSLRSVPGVQVNGPR